MRMPRRRGLLLLLKWDLRVGSAGIPPKNAALLMGVSSAIGISLSSAPGAVARDDVEADAVAFDSDAPAAGSAMADVPASVMSSSMNAANRLAFPMSHRQLGEGDAPRLGSSDFLETPVVRYDS